MIYEPEIVKGFKDSLPPESLKRQAVKKIIEKNFRLYGFMPVETPTLEYDELMRSNSTNEEDEAISDRFRLKDKAGRNLGLRYEFTFQLARIFKQNPNIKLPFRRYQIGSVFRDEPTSSNRFKEITQCDADIIGDKTVKADAECLSLVFKIFKELKIIPEIEINNRKLINSILESVRIQNKTGVMREIDKLDKLGEDEVKSNLKKYADSNQIITLFKLLEKPISFFIENLFDGSEELKKLEDLGKIYGFKVKFNPFMVRGLSYYTGNIFEVKVKDSKSSIAAGVRYDGVIGKFLNKEIPAVGISFGLERICQVASIKTKQTKTLVISLAQSKEAIKLTQKLRNKKISSIISFAKPGKALEYADSYKIPFAIFIGEDEVKKKKFKIRDLKTGKEQLLTEKQILNKLSK